MVFGALTVMLAAPVALFCVDSVTSLLLASTKTILPLVLLVKLGVVTVLLLPRLMPPVAVTMSAGVLIMPLLWVRAPVVVTLAWVPVLPVDKPVMLRAPVFET